MVIYWSLLLLSFFFLHFWIDYFSFVCVCVCLFTVVCHIYLLLLLEMTFSYISFFFVCFCTSCVKVFESSKKTPWFISLTKIYIVCVKQKNHWPQSGHIEKWIVIFWYFLCPLYTDWTCCWILQLWWWWWWKRKKKFANLFFPSKVDTLRTI